MRNYQKKNQLLILCLVVGFFIGIIYQNVIAKTEVVMLDLFLKSNLQLYLETTIVTKNYVWYVIKERLVLFAGIFLFSCLRWKRLFVILLLLVLGFSMGMLTVLSVLQLGIRGIVLCVMGMLPQGIFYGIAGYILVTYCYQHPNQRWNQAKTVFVMVMLGIGVVMEVYVNPMIVKWAIQLIC